MKEFLLGDIVEQNGHVDSLLVVTGYIHDEERVFVTDPTGKLNKGCEFELCFDEITRQWREVMPADYQEPTQ